MAGILWRAKALLFVCFSSFRELISTVPSVFRVYSVELHFEHVGGIYMDSRGTKQSQTKLDGPGAQPNFYESILWNSENIAVAKLSRDWLILNANPALRMITGIENLNGRSVVDLVSADDATNWEQQTGNMRVKPVLLHYVRADGDVTSLRSRLYPMSDFEVLVGEVPVGDLIAAEGVMTSLNNEITTLARENVRNSNAVRKKSEELKVALHDLDTSYWHLKKIQEVLPICMYCHKVKSTANHWEDVAEYLKKNSLFLSHGLCPACVPLFPTSTD